MPRFCRTYAGYSWEAYSEFVADDELVRLSRRARYVAFGAFAAWFAAGMVAGGQIINHTSKKSSVGPVVMIVGMFSGFFVAAGAQRVFLGSRSAAVSAMRHRDALEKNAAPGRAAEAKRIAAVQVAEQRRRADLEREQQASIPGSTEWKRRRYTKRVQQVRLETGIAWRTEFYVKATSPRILQARTLMRSLEAKDRRIEREYLQQQVDERLQQGVLDSPRAAELAMARWMTEQGCSSIRVSPVGADGGIDIAGDGIVAQVKYWRSNSVGRPVVQQLHGAGNGRDCVLFALWSGGYSRQAIEWAEAHDVALLTFDEDGNVVEAHTTAAMLRFSMQIAHPRSRPLRTN